jgi:AcrR family transcriptional regulator
VDKRQDETAFEAMGRQSPEDRLIDAGKRLFCRQGIHATGVAEILKAARVSRKTLYEIFNSKEQLIQAVLERDGEEWRAWFSERILAQEGNPRERLLSIFDILEEWFSSAEFSGCPFINAVAEHDKLTLPMQQLALAHRQGISAILLDLVRQVEAPSPEALTEKLAILMDGATVTAMVSRDPGVTMYSREMARAIIDDALDRPQGELSTASTAAG